MVTLAFCKAAEKTMYNSIVTGDIKLMYGHQGLWPQNCGSLLKSMKIYFFIYYFNRELHEKHGTLPKTMDL